MRGFPTAPVPWIMDHTRHEFRRFFSESAPAVLHPWYDTVLGSAVVKFSRGAEEAVPLGQSTWHVRAASAASEAHRAARLSVIFVRAQPSAVLPLCFFPGSTCQPPVPRIIIRSVLPQ